MDDIDKFVNNLLYLSDGVAEEVKKAMAVGLKQIQSDAKGAVTPVTGQLRNSITTDVKTEPNGDIVGTVGTNVHYAIYVEYGTGPKGEASAKTLPDGFTPKYRQTAWSYTDKDGKKWWTRGQPAKPFLYPAFKQNEAEVKKRIMDAAVSALKSANERKGGDNA